MECKVAIGKIHDYLDGELSYVETDHLQTHLHQCTGCSKQLEQLEKTENALFRSVECTKKASRYDVVASNQLNERILAGLPKQRSKTPQNTFIRMLYRHPGITAAAVFLVIIFTSLFASWGQDTKLTVSGEDLQQIIIQGNTVIVPEGVEISGNLTVENGKVEVLGSVDGDVTVIDGTMVLASTGHIAGQSRTIDQALDWFWYKVIATFDNTISP